MHQVGLEVVLEVISTFTAHGLTRLTSDTPFATLTGLDRPDINAI